jgi:acetolactate synthase small subunit
MRHILAVLVENQPGVLTRVSGLFSRRGYNIDSLAVGQTHDPGVSRMTIVVDGDDQVIEQVVKQLDKLVDVIDVRDIAVDQFPRHYPFLSGVFGHYFFSNRHTHKASSPTSWSTLFSAFK